MKYFETIISPIKPYVNIQICMYMLRHPVSCISVYVGKKVNVYESTYIIHVIK